MTAATVSYILTGSEAMFKFHMDEPVFDGAYPIGYSCWGLLADWSLCILPVL